MSSKWRANGVEAGDMVRLDDGDFEGRLGHGAMYTDENGLTLSYEWGTTKERLAFATALSIDLDTLTAARMKEILADIVRGRSGDSLANPLMKGEGDRMVCPLAYRLSRDAGIDPAGFLLLEKAHCYVTMSVPRWCGDLSFATHRNGLEMQAPLASGVAWRGGWPGPRDVVIASVLSIDTDIHHIPDTMKSSLRGRRLGDVMDHPLLNPDLVIRAVALEDDEDEPGGVDLRFTENPPLIRLRDAARDYAAMSPLTGDPQ